MTKNYKYKILDVQFTEGKFGEYRYKSPRYGYKQAYKYTQIIAVSYNGKQIAKLLTKYLLKREINDYLDSIVNFINNTDFSNMVNRYKQATNLNIDYGFVRTLKESAIAK